MKFFRYLESKLEACISTIRQDNPSLLQRTPYPKIFISSRLENKCKNYCLRHPLPPKKENPFLGEEMEKSKRAKLCYVEKKPAIISLNLQE